MLLSLRLLSTTAALLALAVNTSAVIADESARVDVFAGSGSPAGREAAYEPAAPALPPLQISLGNPFGVEVRGTDVWITTVDDHCVWRTALSPTGIRRVAGSGVEGLSADGVGALHAAFRWPHEVRVDERGDLYIADTRNHVIRRVDAESGEVSTLAGNGHPGFAGDGATGAEVQFDQPHSVALDGDGGLLVADTKNHRVRRIDLVSGVTETIAGTGERELPEDGAVAATAPLFGPRSLAVDASAIWIVLREGNSIWRLDRSDGTLRRIAGTGEKGYEGDGGPALDATFNGPKGLCVADDGALLVVDTENHAVRRIDLDSGRIDTIIGGTRGVPADGLKRPHGIAPLPGGGCLLADSEHNRVLLWQPTR